MAKPKATRRQGRPGIDPDLWLPLAMEFWKHQKKAGLSEHAAAVAVVRAHWHDWPAKLRADRKAPTVEGRARYLKDLVQGHTTEISAAFIRSLKIPKATERAIVRLVGHIKRVRESDYAPDRKRMLVTEYLQLLDGYFR